ncbi:MAG: nitrous oxide reductase family maturation protein NosD [Promethearchaeota archaeon]
MLLVSILNKGIISNKYINIDSSSTCSDYIDPKIKEITPKISQSRPIFCTGNFSDEGKDLDGDLLYDVIVLYFEVNVSQLFSNFTVKIDVEPQMANGTSTGVTLEVTKTFHWKYIGLHYLDVSLINASRFHSLGRNLMFNIKTVQITRISEVYLIPITVSTQHNLYTTREYWDVEFDFFINIIGDIWDRAEDTDYNWRFDYIIIGFTVEILQNTEFTAKMTLDPESDPGNTLTGENTSSFEKGVNTISIRFDTDSVREKKINGSLNVTNIEILVEDNTVYQGNPNYLTHSYVYTDFDVHSLSINGNEEFMAFVNSEKLKGSGSPSEPYIISGFIMTGESTKTYGIKIRNVDFVFHIINNIIHYSGTAISIEYVTHCLVADNDLRKNKHGIFLENADNCSIRNNLVNNHDIGLYLNYADNNVIDCNVFNRNTQSIVIYRSNENIIVNNSISGRTRKIDDIGLHIGTYSNENLIIQNDFQNNDIQAYDLGINNEFRSNYWNDWIGEGYYWIPEKTDENPSSTKNYDQFPSLMPNHIAGLTIISPTTKTYFDPVITINWVVYDILGYGLIYNIYYSIENETSNTNSWSPLITEMTRNHFDWNVRNITEGNYRIKIVVYDSFGFSSWRISDQFTIKIPFNPAPIIHPLIGMVILVLVSIFLLIKFT